MVWTSPSLSLYSYICLYWPEIFCLKGLVLSACMYVMVFQDKHILTKWNILSNCLLIYSRERIFLFFFFFNFLSGPRSILWSHWLLLFWTSCVLPHGFQIQSGYLACTLSCLHAVILKVTSGATPAFSTNRGVHCISMYMAWWPVMFTLGGCTCLGRPLHTYEQREQGLWDRIFLANTDIHASRENAIYINASTKLCKSKFPDVTLTLWKTRISA